MGFSAAVFPETTDAAHVDLPALVAAGRVCAGPRRRRAWAGSRGGRVEGGHGR